MFRLRARLMLIEQLVLRNALLEPVLNHRWPISKSQQTLKGWLDSNVQVTDLAYGKHFQDPAIAALYADEVKEAADDLKERIDLIARDLEQNLGSHKKPL